MISNGVTATSIAIRVGCSHVTVGSWARREGRPELDTRPLVETVTGIPVADWLTADERRVASAPIVARGER